MRALCLAFACLLLASRAEEAPPTSDQIPPPDEDEDFAPPAPPKNHTIDGITFPDVVPWNEMFVGGGSRLKYGLVRVYAAALYIAHTEVCRTTECLVTEEASSRDKTLLLTFHRDIDAPAISGALKEALSPKLDKARLGEFEKNLNHAIGKDGVKKGSQLSFSCDVDGMQISGRDIDDLEEEDFHDDADADVTVCQALFEVYLGPKPIAPAFKEAVAKAFKDPNFPPPEELEEDSDSDSDDSGSDDEHFPEFPGAGEEEEDEGALEGAVAEQSEEKKEEL